MKARGVDFGTLPGVPCRCGTARRAFADVAEFPATVHVTEIKIDSERHYYKRLTEAYYFLECGACADGAGIGWIVIPANLPLHQNASGFDIAAPQEGDKYVLRIALDLAGVSSMTVSWFHDFNDAAPANTSGRTVYETLTIC